MRRAEFDRLVSGEFGRHSAEWTITSHVLQHYGHTPVEMIEQGADLRDVWLALCDDFDVPEERRLGEDI